MADAKLIAKRNLYREGPCNGCRNNYYNWPKPASPRGDVAVAEDKCCWSLEKATLNNGRASCNLS